MSAELTAYSFAPSVGVHDAAIAGLRSAPIGIATTSLAGALQYANDTFRRIFDIDAFDYLGLDIDVATRNLLGRDFLTSVARNTRPRQICVTIGEGDAARYFLCTGARVLHGSLPIYLSVAAQEITELYREYGARMELLRGLMVENGIAGAWNWLMHQPTPERLITSPVAWLSDVGGLFGKHNVPRSFDAFVERIVPQCRQPFVAAISAAIAQRSSYSIEYRMMADGEMRRMRSVGEYVAGETDVDGRLVSIEVDVTPATSGKSARDICGMLLQSIEMPVIWIDRQLRYQYFNETFATLSSVAWSRNPAVDQDVLGAIENPARRRYLEGVLKRALRGESVVFESEILDDRGEVCQWIDFHCKPTYDVDGEIDGVAVLGYDISPLKRASLRQQHFNFELRQRLDRRAVKIEMANRALSNRVSVACASLRGKAREIEAILAGASAERGAGELERARAALVEMQVQIDGLTRIASLGMRTPERRCFSMNRCVQEVLRDLNFKHEGRPIVFAVERLPDVEADKLLIKQVLQNLLSNAIDATRAVRAPHIRVWAEERDGVVVWSVGDNGPGFDPRTAEQLFGTFAAQGAAVRGVGLNVAWWAIQQMNGRIWCESVPGQGAVFRFTIGDLGEARLEGGSDH